MGIQDYITGLFSLWGLTPRFRRLRRLRGVNIFGRLKRRRARGSRPGAVINHIRRQVSSNQDAKAIFQCPFSDCISEP